MYTLLLVLYSAAGAPLSVKYGALDTAAVIIIIYGGPRGSKYVMRSIV